MKFIKNKTKALAMCLSVVALAGVTNAFCVNEADAIIVNDEITNAAVRTTTLDAMIPYKEDGYDNAQTWLVDKCNMKDSQFDDVIYIIQNYGDYLEQNDILEIQDIMEKQSVCDTITELKQYKARLDSWKQYGADKKQKALQEKKEAEERAAQEAAAQKAAAQVSYQNQQSNLYSTPSYSYSNYSWNGSARNFFVSGMTLRTEEAAFNVAQSTRSRSPSFTTPRTRSGWCRWTALRRWSDELLRNL